MKALVGYTGFVGSNIFEYSDFEHVYNSQNIKEAYGTEPELLIYAGIRAEKFWANSNAILDLEHIEQAGENIKRINPKRLVLISTIDVFKTPCQVDERSEVDIEGLHPYGYNRYQLECIVRDSYSEALIVRLPGLYGKNIKKNFIYDMIYRIPTILGKEKMEELALKEAKLWEFYYLQEDGFYRLKNLERSKKQYLRKMYEQLEFNALNFTDSRSCFQFYPLNRLWNDIQIALEDHIKLLHPATEPVSAKELYDYIYGEEFENKLLGVPAKYDYRTIYDKNFGGENGYICKKKEILEDISKFVKEYESKVQRSKCGL